MKKFLKLYGIIIHAKDFSLSQLHELQNYLERTEK